MHIHIYSYYIFKSHTHISISYICISLYHIYMSHCSRILLSVSLLSCIHGMHMLLSVSFTLIHILIYIRRIQCMYASHSLTFIYLYITSINIHLYHICIHSIIMHIYISIYLFIHIVISYIYFPSTHHIHMVYIHALSCIINAFMSH